MVNLGELQDVPSARRVARADWRDPRLWVGVALVAVSVIAGARIVGGADDTVGIWAVRADVARGGLLEPGDLVERQVRFADASDSERYLRSLDGVPVDRHVLRGVGAGELLPADAVGKAPGGEVQVSVALRSAQVPPGVRAGSSVDVWFSPQQASGDREAKALATDVTVVEAPSPAKEFAGAAGERQVVLALVDDAAVAEVIAAGSSGQLMLVGRS